ncbi:hypothetical protein C8J56DRAFT_1039018 [Mycena floridula]|nr:hypothetical protein C8J56DRAFT_1039018 [Mycena floridula]
MRQFVVDVTQLPKLQSEDIWLGMSSPPLHYRMPHPSPSRAAWPIVHGVDEDDKDCALLQSPLQPAWQGITYVIYHGEHGSYAGFYQTWAELTPIVGQKMPFTKSSIFKKFHSFEQAQRSLSQLSSCGVIEALRFQIPGDGYECRVITHGHKPGIYTSWKLFVSDGLGHGTGTFQYFLGPSTKKCAEAYMKTVEKSRNVAWLACSIFPEKVLSSKVKEGFHAAPSGSLVDQNDDLSANQGDGDMDMEEGILEGETALPISHEGGEWGEIEDLWVKVQHDQAKKRTYKEY